MIRMADFLKWARVTAGESNQGTDPPDFACESPDVTVLDPLKLAAKMNALLLQMTDRNHARWLCEGVAGNRLVVGHEKRVH